MKNRKSIRSACLHAIVRAGCVLTSLVILMSIMGGSCDSGRPVIDRFVLRYDIVAIADSTQEIEWNVKHVSGISLSLRNASDQEVWAKSVPSGTSSGMHDVSVASLDPGEYKLVLTASNSKGTAEDSREFLLVGREGLWFSFAKRVERPQEGPWYGFANARIPVGYIQGSQDHEETLSVSEQVVFRQIRWRPNSLRWADQEGCTSPGLEIMSVRKLTSGHTYDSGQTYQFPAEWGVTGTYSCSVDWSPCNFGWEGERQTFQDVEFILELEAIGYQ